MYETISKPRKCFHVRKLHECQYNSQRVNSFVSLYGLGGTSPKQSSGHSKETSEKHIGQTNEDLIQSRSIDHLLCGTNGKKLVFKRNLKF